MQTLDKLSDEQFKLRISQITIQHFLNQRLHKLQRILLQTVSVYSLLLVDVQQIILVDLTHQQFLQWAAEARKEKLKCAAGIITMEAYLDWLKNSK